MMGSQPSGQSAAKAARYPRHVTQKVIQEHLGKDVVVDQAALGLHELFIPAEPRCFHPDRTVGPRSLEDRRCLP